MNSSTEKNTDKQKHSGFQQDLDFLRQIPLFQNLEYECLKLMAMLSKKVDFVEGDQLMVQGEDDGNAYYIISGKLNGSYKKNDTQYPVQLIEPGQFIGGIALLGKSIRLFTIQAMEKSTVLRLNRDGFQKIMKQYPDSMVKIAANLTAGLTTWEQNLLNKEDMLQSEQNVYVLGLSLL